MIKLLWLGLVIAVLWAGVLVLAQMLRARYYQEVAPGVALDRAEVVSLTDTLKQPAGNFANCLKIEETTPLKAGKEYKYYAPGIGLVQDDTLKLVKYGPTKQ